MTILARCLLSVIAVLSVTSLVAAQNPPVSTTKSTTIFTQMKSLVGEWEAVQDGVSVKET